MDPVGMQSTYETCELLSCYIAFNMALLTRRIARDMYGYLEEQQGYDMTSGKLHTSPLMPF